MNMQAEATPHSNLTQNKSWWLHYKLLESGFKPELAITALSGLEKTSDVTAERASLLWNLQKGRKTDVAKYPTEAAPFFPRSHPLD